MPLPMIDPTITVTPFNKVILAFNSTLSSPFPETSFISISSIFATWGTGEYSSDFGGILKSELVSAFCVKVFKSKNYFIVKPKKKKICKENVFRFNSRNTTIESILSFNNSSQSSQLTVVQMINKRKINKYGLSLSLILSFVVSIKKKTSHSCSHLVTNTKCKK